MSLFRRKSAVVGGGAGPVAVSAGGVAGGARDDVVVDAARERRTFEIGSSLLEIARGRKAGLFSAQFYSDKLMDWSMKDQAFKVQLFRFVDAFPMLTTSDAVFEHLTDYMSQPGVKAPPGMELGLKAGGIAKGLATSTISSQIRSMAGKFIAGTDAASALAKLEKLWKSGIAFSVDLLGEACVSEDEADAYQAKYLDLVENLPGSVSSWAADDRLERDHLGAIPRTNVSVKISSLSSRCDPIDSEGAIRGLMRRLEPILESARDKGVFINFDMEQFSLKDLTLDLFMRCCERVDFHAGLAMQAYLRSGVDDARRLSAWAKAKNRRVTVRLVKGAYWDYEVIHAEQQGWPCPVWGVKAETDLCFERMTDVLLDAVPRSAGEGGVTLALGSHNVRSIAWCLSGMERRGLPASAVELQMLHGMADQLKAAAGEMVVGVGASATKGLRVREYVPVGELIPGMAYLVRRLLENTSNESWLKAGFLHNASAESLLRSPAEMVGDGKSSSQTAGKNGAAVVGGGAGGVVGSGGVGGVGNQLHQIAPERHRLSDAHAKVGDGRAFFNESMRDFSRKDHRDAFASAVARSVVPTVASDRTVEQASAMIGAAHGAFGAWRDVGQVDRSAVLVRAAAAMRARRDELAGVMIRESGKTWREADADVCEAIDFCEYYAREAIRLFERKRLGKFIGELDEVWHQPRGVCAVISPWNFPLAICCGMAVAALGTGNTVIVKPAEQTTGIASILCEILWRSVEEVVGPTIGRSGVSSRDVLHFCPAPGETTGASIVRDDRVALIAFTGSKAVGLDIVRAAGMTSERQEHVKKVVCEMGGKNAIIVDVSADWDEAVLGVRHSAFGFQGQKCSTCSRCIVVDPEGPSGAAITRFTHRLVEATRSLVVGDPTLAGSDVGPVIDAESESRIRRFIETAKREGCRVELELELPSGAAEVAGGCRPSGAAPRFVGPVIFSGVKPEHSIAREEIFGPVLAVMHASSFEEALAIANGVPYKLTGAVYTRKPSHIERAKREFRVGNLYINRGSTGALVGRQPFGGFGMSGVGSKAGGSEYLLQFVEPRASCENTMRRGFAPEL